MTKPIELRHLEQYVFGDRSLLDEILTIFIDQVGLLVDRLQESEDDVEWRSAAHTLKGASRGVGAWALGDLAELAEKLKAEENPEDRSKILKQISIAAGAAVTYAKFIRDQGEGGESRMN